MLEPALLLGSFAFLGAGIKYIDCVFDENVFNEKLAYALAIVCGVFMGWLIVADQYAAVILISITLGVALGSKIDNIAFIIGALLVLFVPLFLNQFQGILLFPIGILVLAEVIDDIGNGLSDSKRIQNKIMQFFFRYRLTLEVALIGLVVFNVMPVIYWLCLVSFDLAYHFVGGYADRVKLAQVRMTMGEDENEVWLRLDRKNKHAH